MACHDQGKQAINLTLSVPRNAWTPIPGIPGKIETTVKCDHLGDIAGVAHLDLLGTEHGQVTGMTLHRVEGLPTGATLGVVVGHQDEDKNKFMPLKATETTAHVDMSGDTHIYHAMAVGKSDAGSKQFAPSDDVANVDQITAKIERWSHADPEDVQYQSFTGTNAKGQTKSVAAIHTSSPLGELIKRNEKPQIYRHDGCDPISDQRRARLLCDGCRTGQDPRVGPQGRAWAADRGGPSTPWPSGCSPTPRPWRALAPTRTTCTSRCTGKTPRRLPTTVTAATRAARSLPTRW